MATIACALLGGCAEMGDEPVGTEPTSNTRLATFEMSNGNRLTLTSVAPDNEIYVSETTPAGEGERFVVDDFPGATPLELFARLAPAGTAVPPLLVDSATDEDRATWMARRQLGTAPSAGEIYVDVEQLGWPTVSSAAPGYGSCDPSVGYQYFIDHHCGTAGGWGYGANEEYCDYAKQWDGKTRDSNEKMRHTYTRTAACDGTGRIRHSKKNISGWHTVMDEPIEANTVATYWTYQKTGLKHLRRSRAEPLDPFDTDAYTRLWTHFDDQVSPSAP